MQIIQSFYGQELCQQFGKVRNWEGFLDDATPTLRPRVLFVVQASTANCLGWQHLWARYAIADKYIILHLYHK